MKHEETRQILTKVSFFFVGLLTLGSSSLCCSQMPCIGNLLESITRPMVSSNIKGGATIVITEHHYREKQVFHQNHCYNETYKWVQFVLQFRFQLAMEWLRPPGGYRRRLVPDSGDYSFGHSRRITSWLSKKKNVGAVIIVVGLDYATIPKKKKNNPWTTG